MVVARSNLWREREGERGRGGRGGRGGKNEVERGGERAEIGREREREVKHKCREHISRQDNALKRGEKLSKINFIRSPSPHLFAVLPCQSLHQLWSSLVVCRRVPQATAVALAPAVDVSCIGETYGKAFLSGCSDSDASHHLHDVDTCRVGREGERDGDI